VARVRHDYFSSVEFLADRLVSRARSTAISPVDHRDRTH
jgi:hypothetical protein